MDFEMFFSTLAMVEKKYLVGVQGEAETVEESKRWWHGRMRDLKLSPQSDSSFLCSL